MNSFSTVVRKWRQQSSAFLDQIIVHTGIYKTEVAETIGGEEKGPSGAEGVRSEPRVNNARRLKDGDGKKVEDERKLDGKVREEDLKEQERQEGYANGHRPTEE